MTIPFQVIVAALESIQQVRILWLSWTLGRLYWSSAAHTAVDVWSSPPYWGHVHAGLLGRGSSAMIPTAEPVLVYCSSGREIKVCDLPVFKVELCPKQSTQTLPWFTIWAIVAQNAGKGHKHTSLSAPVCTTVSVLCSLLVPLSDLQFGCKWNSVLFFF